MAEEQTKKVLPYLKDDILELCEYLEKKGKERKIELGMTDDETMTYLESVLANLYTEHIAIHFTDITKKTEDIAEWTADVIFTLVSNKLANYRNEQPDTQNIH